MVKALLFTSLLLLLSCWQLRAENTVKNRIDWVHSARIVTPEGVEDLPAVQRDGANVVLFHVNGLPDPDALVGVLYPDLAKLKKDNPGLRIVIYISPLEVQTRDADKDGDGKLDPGQHTFFTDHRESVQVGIDGQPVVSYGQAAFWVEKGSEDCWVTPTSPYVRQRAIALVKRIAADGADGIWFDVPRFVMWWNGKGPYWSSYDRFSVADFKAKTGFDAPHKANWQDPAWRAWAQWRQDTMAGFVNTLRQAAHSVSPTLRFGVEHYGGFDRQGPAEGWAATKLWEVTDYLAHEYDTAARSTARSRYYSWLYDNAVFSFYRGVDRDHPTWMLTYADSGDAQRLNAASEISHGCCYYDTNPPGMSGSADYGARKEIFSYIRARQGYYYDPTLRPMRKVGLLFSQQTIDRVDLAAEDDVFASEFFGVAMMLLESNVPFQAFAEDSLGSLNGIDLLILPGAQCIGPTQVFQLRDFVKRGGKILALGENAAMDENGTPTPETAKALLTGQLTGPPVGGQYLRLTRSRRRARGNTAESDQDQAQGEWLRRQFLAMLQPAGIDRPLQTDAPRKVLLLPYVSDTRIIVRATNYSDVGPGRLVSKPITGIDVRVSVPTGKRVVGARQIDYPSGEEKSLPVRVSGGVVSATFDIGIHKLLVFELGPA